MKLKTIGSNQTEVIINGNTILFSYNTPVAACLAEGGFIRTSKKWSVTTSKHIVAWLNKANAKEVEQSVLDNLAN
jgi:hypothetical protein